MESTGQAGLRGDEGGGDAFGVAFMIDDTLSPPRVDVQSVVEGAESCMVLRIGQFCLVKKPGDYPRIKLHTVIEGVRNNCIRNIY